MMLLFYMLGVKGDRIRNEENGNFISQEIYDMLPVKAITL